MRWIVVIGSGAVLLVVVAFVVGLLRPAVHEASTRSVLSVPVRDVWAVLSDWEKWPEWQPEIREVERLEDRRGHTVLMLTGGWGAMRAEIVESEAPARMVTEVDGGSFRGRWTYVLERSGAGTVVSITERGEVGNPLFRAMMIFHDNHATMMAFHRALAARLGVSVEPERVEPEAADSVSG